MALEPKVFKAYDVRGIYPAELDEAGAYAIGRAYAEQFEPKTIAVGRDMRLSSPTMHEAFVRGAAEAGAEVIDIGMIGTEMLYYAVGELGLDGGATITASHNPKEYTGTKIVRRGALPVGSDSGLLDIRDRALSIMDELRAGAGAVGVADPGTCIRASSTRCCRSSIRSLSGPCASWSTPRTAWAARCCRRSSSASPCRPFPATSNRTAASQPRAEPTPRREPLVHHRQGQGGGETSGSPSTVTPTVASSWTTRASSSLEIRDDAARRVDAGEGAGRNDHLRRSGELGRAGRRRAPGGTAVMGRVGHAFIKILSRGRRGVRRRGQRPLLLPRLLPGRSGTSRRS